MGKDEIEWVSVVLTLMADGEVVGQRGCPMGAISDSHPGSPGSSSTW